MATAIEPDAAVVVPNVRLVAEVFADVARHETPLLSMLFAYRSRARVGGGALAALRFAAKRSAWISTSGGCCTTWAARDLEQSAGQAVPAG